MTWAVSDVMSKDVTAVGPAGTVLAPGTVATTANTPLATAASLMFQHRISVLPVVDSRNRLVGVVSRSRLLRVFLRSDESIRKEIVREYLRDSPLFKGEKVAAEVKDGIVHLYGEVETGGQTGLLIRLLAGVPGVVGVESHLEVAGERAAADPAPLAKSHA
jgi:CBS domain-containing protein